MCITVTFSVLLSLQGMYQLLEWRLILSTVSEINNTLVRVRENSLYLILFKVFPIPFVHKAAQSS